MTMLTAPMIAGHAKDPQLYETLKQMRDSINSATNLGSSKGILPVSRGGTGTAVGSITGPGSLYYAASGTRGHVSLMPSGLGNVGLGTLNPTLFKVQASGHVGPSMNYRYDLGGPFTRWRALFANELWVQTLVAEEVLATVGGRILVGPTTKLAEDIDTVVTTIKLEHNEAAHDDILYMQTAPGGVQQSEFMRVVSGPTGTGPYAYVVERSIDSQYPNSWIAGDAVFNTGIIGDGFIDLYAQHGVRGASELGPSIVGNVRTTDEFDGWEPRWAVGNLKGLYGYGALDTDPSVYGAAFGRAAGAWLTIDPTNGVRIGHGTSAPKVWVKADGSAVFTGEVTIVEGSALATALENAQDDATQALADAATANAKIGDMASDSLLVPTEKKQLIREVGDIRNEEPGIYALALTVRNTTERAAYLAAFNALEAYLLTLTGPPTTYSAWDDLSKNTTIVADTFKTKFATYYTKRQLLLDANATLAAKDAADANVVAVAAAKTANWESIVGGSEGAPNVKLALPATTKGLCLNASYMGFYDTLGYPATPWRTYMDSDGKFYLKGASDTGNRLTWDGTTLAIKGQITVVAGGNAATTGDVAGANDLADAAQAAADAAAAAALAAHNLADAAQVTADTAKGLIDDMSLDSILSPVEKPALIREVAVITGEYAGIHGLALSVRNATEQLNYGTAYTNLTNYLATLTSAVAWNVTTGNTDVIGGTFRAQFNAYYNTRQLLLDANTALAAADAATAKGVADTATGLISSRAADNLLTAMEKPAIIEAVAAIDAEKPGIYGSALSIANTFARADYLAAYDELKAYLALQTTPTLWSSLAGNTTIVGATFRGKFSDYYTARQALLNAGAVTASSTAYWASITGIPGTLAPPSLTDTGLFLGADHLGFYKTGTWKTYMTNDGDFYLAGPDGSTHGLTWDHNYLGYGVAKLSITGAVSVGSILIDENGPLINAGTAETQEQTYGFKYGTTYLGGLSTYYHSGTGTYIYSLGAPATLTGHVRVGLHANASLGATVMLTASSSGGGTGNVGAMSLEGRPSSGGWADFTGVGLFVKDKGLMVGGDHTSGIPAAGAIIATGDLTIDGNLRVSDTSILYLRGGTNVQNGFQWDSGFNGVTAFGQIGFAIYSVYDAAYLALFRADSWGIRFLRDLDLYGGAALKVASTKVVGAQGAAVADATNTTDVITQLNALLARLRTHGLIAT